MFLSRLLRNRIEIAMPSHDMFHQECLIDSIGQPIQKSEIIPAGMRTPVPGLTTRVQNDRQRSEFTTHSGKTLINQQFSKRSPI
jgi:hypothetical protein